MRIGIFSGTFDPIHDGHILFAQTALDQMGLSKVIFLPEPHPRRKDEAVDINYRAAMIQKIIDKAPQFELKVHDDEAHSVASTYTWLRETYPEDDLFFIMGSDVFEHIEDWPDINILLENTGFIVALMGEDDGEIVVPQAKQIGAQAEFIPSPLGSVRSSMIRRSILDGVLAKGLDDDVAEFIEQHQLYRT